MKKLLTSALLFVSVAIGANSQVWEFYDMTTIPAMPNNSPVAIAEDNTGHIWASLWGDGIMQLDPVTDNAIIFNTSNSALQNDFIRAIVVDPATGFVWVGSDLGVSYYNGTVWNNFDISDGLAGPQVKSIAIEANGTKWFICDDPNNVDKGLTKLDPTNTIFTNYTLANTPAMITENLSLVRQDPATNFIWVGTVDAGILIYDPTLDSWNRIYSGNSSLNGDEVTALVFSSTGDKFVGVRNPVAMTFNGLDKINASNSTITNYNKANTSGGLFQDKVSDLYFDLSNNLWIATDSGATQYDYTSNTWLNTFRTLVDFPVPNTEVISRVFVDTDGRKWFTTVNHGLIRLGCETGNTNIKIIVTQHNDVTCYGQNNGNLAIGTINGTGPYKYRWSNGSPNSNTASNLAPGSITINVTDAAGCAADTNITITEPAEVVANATKNANTLTADDAGTGATYTWINCATNASVGTGRTYEATQNGQFAAVVTISGCSDTSSCLTVSGIGIEENNVSFAIYPNPATDYLTIDITKKSVDFLSIVDISGKLVYQANNLAGKQIIPVQNLNSGIYIVKIQTGDKTTFQKFVKK